MIRISRNLDLKAQVYLESIFDHSMQEGLFEKTIDPITQEPVYVPLFKRETILDLDSI